MGPGHGLVVRAFGILNEFDIWNSSQCADNGEVMVTMGGGGGGGGGGMFHHGMSSRG